jgi:uncharacterized phage protein gp47/JayE
MDYIDPPIVTEPDDLAADAFDYLEANIPGWLPSPGNLEVWQIEAVSQLASELAYVASAVPVSIFRYYGESLLGLPAHEATYANGLTTWTMRDNLGYTVPAGTLIGIPATGDELLPFAVAQDVVIAPGSTTATDVIVVAEDPGTDANGLTGTPELVDALDFVNTITLQAPTSGGVDDEADDDYLNRLRSTFTILAPRPILPNDFAVLAMTVPGVARASAIDLYNPGPPVATNVPRCVTVVVADENGQDPGPTVRGEVDALLQSQREVNFLVFVVGPTLVTINVSFTFKPYPAYAPADVQARAEQAVSDYLSPANFGAVPYGETPQWINDTAVRFLEVAEAINRVEGLWYVGTLTVNGGTADVPLAATALPQPGTITGTPL